MPRTLEELLVAKSRVRPGGAEVVVMVDAEEGRILATAGAVVSSGSENLTRRTQRYTIGERIYLWLAGHFPADPKDAWPVDMSVDARVAEAMRAFEETGGDLCWD